MSLVHDVQFTHLSNPCELCNRPLIDDGHPEADTASAKSASGLVCDLLHQEETQLGKICGAQ